MKIRENDANFLCYEMFSFGKLERRKNGTYFMCRRPAFLRVSLFLSKENKNRLSSTTCGEELKKNFKDWQSFKGFLSKSTKKNNQF